MNKVIKHVIVFVGLFCIASSALAVTIPDYLGYGNDPNGFALLLGKIANGVGVLIASLGTIMIIVAGILYLTSAGSPERTGVAKKALIYAIVGIAIGISAQAIVAIVLGIIKKWNF